MLARKRSQFYSHALQRLRLYPAPSSWSGVNLHAYYTALETLLERVARLVDEDVPSGATWHRDLLSQMRIELPGLRPRAIPPELIEYSPTHRL